MPIRILFVTVLLGLGHGWELNCVHLFFATGFQFEEDTSVGSPNVLPVAKVVFLMFAMLPNIARGCRPKVVGFK